MNISILNTLNWTWWNRPHCLMGKKRHQMEKKETKICTIQLTVTFVVSSMSLGGDSTDDQRINSLKKKRFFRTQWWCWWWFRIYSCKLWTRITHNVNGKSYKMRSHTHTLSRSPRNGKRKRGEKAWKGRHFTTIKSDLCNTYDMPKWHIHWRIERVIEWKSRNEISHQWRSRRSRRDNQM